MSNPIMLGNDSETFVIGDRGFASFALAFTITQLVEIPIYVRALRPPHAAAPRPLAIRIAIAFGASALTHPIVWFVIPYLTLLLMFAAGTIPGVLTRTLLYGVIAEGFAVLAEARYLRAFGVRRPLAWSLGANFASFVVGTAVVKLLSFP